MNTPLTCLNYIDGEWIPAQSGATLESRNPADWRELIATVPNSDSADVDAAVEAAREPIRPGGWFPPLCGRR